MKGLANQFILARFYHHLDAFKLVLFTEWGLVYPQVNQLSDLERGQYLEQVWSFANDYLDMYCRMSMDKMSQRIRTFVGESPLHLSRLPNALQQEFLSRPLNQLSVLEFMEAEAEVAREEAKHKSEEGKYPVQEIKAMDDGFITANLILYNAGLTLREIQQSSKENKLYAEGEEEDNGPILQFQSNLIKTTGALEPDKTSPAQIILPLSAERYLPSMRSPLPNGEISAHDYTNITIGGEEAIYVCGDFLSEFIIAQAHHTLDGFTDILVSQYNATYPPNPNFTKAQRRIYDFRLARALIDLLKDFQKWRRKAIKFDLLSRRRALDIKEHSPGLQSLLRREDISLDAISALLASEDKLNERKDKAESVRAQELQDERKNTRDAVLREFGLDKASDSSGAESEDGDVAEVQGELGEVSDSSDWGQDDLGPESDVDVVPSSQPDEQYYSVPDPIPMSNTSTIAGPRFPIELFRPIALMCDCPVAISRLSRCSKILNHEAAPALYRKIHFTKASRDLRRGTASDYLTFIAKASRWCNKFVLKGCVLDERIIIMLLHLTHLVELHFNSCTVQDDWPVRALNRVRILHVTEIKWDCIMTAWVLLSCPSATEATLIYAGATYTPGSHCLWMADSPEVEPGEPGRPSGPGLGLLRIKVHVDFQEIFLEAIVESGIVLGGIMQLKIDIWGPPSTATGSELPNIIVAPRIFEDFTNLSHVSIVTNSRITELVTTMRDLPLLPNLKQYLIKVLVHDLDPVQDPEDWGRLDERIWSDKRKHVAPCGRGVIFRHILQDRFESGQAGQVNSGHEKWPNIYDICLATLAVDKDTRDNIQQQNAQDHVPLWLNGQTTTVFL
ncbi:hypothetical protein C8J56DRAFT_905777 [Mycena floridula]|nr:hypothetical protein C8J56DRAFT_905777 [Mycena floridula]